MRSWLFAEATGRMKGVAYDREIVAIGTIFHDIGLTASVSGPNRFEVNGADAAPSFVRGKAESTTELVTDRLAAVFPESRPWVGITCLARTASEIVSEDSDAGPALTV